MRNRASHHPPQDAPDHPAIDHAAIDAAISPSALSRKWSGMRPYWPSAYFFERAPAIVVMPGSKKWMCPKTGAFGDGSVSLVAHVLEISPDEAALRLARFLCVARRLRLSQFEKRIEKAA